MSRVNPENEQAARDAGYAAAKRGENCVPAHCTIYRGLIADFRVGDGAAHLAQRWIEGHRQLHAENLAASA